MSHESLTATGDPASNVRQWVAALPANKAARATAAKRSPGQTPLAESEV